MASLSEDQAAGLRRIFAQGREAAHVVFSGSRASATRGMLVATLAQTLAQAGREVVVVDENPGPGGVAAACGVAARFDLLQAVNGDVPLAQVLLQPWPGVRIVPAARAARECGRLDGMRRQTLTDWLRRLHQGADFVLTDASDQGGTHFLQPTPDAPKRVIVAAANSLSITEAYAQLKRQARQDGCRTFDLIVVHAADLREGETIFDNMGEVARRHLGVELRLLGCLQARTAPGPACRLLAEGLLRRATTDTEEDFSAQLRHLGRSLRSALHPVV